MLSTHRCIYQVTTRIPSLLRQQPKLYSISQLTSNLQVQVCAASSILTRGKLQQKPELLLRQALKPYESQSMHQKEQQVQSNIKNESDTSSSSAKPATTYKEKLKQAMSQYGSTVIVFHITISLISLGICYMVVASGLDLSIVLEKVGLSESTITKMASTSGTFAAAYVVHKVFAPVRMTMTLTCVPFIVRYLRKIGLIKQALPKVGNLPKKGN